VVKHVVTIVEHWPLVRAELVCMCGWFASSPSSEEIRRLAKEHEKLDGRK
jgi:hypothetical protein